jgi:serine/threonine protein kinase
MDPPEYTEGEDSEDEGLSDYKPKGYHPVHIGEVLLDRYIITQKLGWGHFSTAWLAFDIKHGNYVCIKIQKSDQRYINAAYDEVEILQELAKHNFDKEWLESLKEYWKDQPEKIKDLDIMEHTQTVQLLNSFLYAGIHGRHFCMVFEIVGVTLLELIKRYNYRGIPLPFIRIITKQILIGLDFLHRFCNIIHTDLKPENILVCLTDEELKQIALTGSLNDPKAEKDYYNNNNDNCDEDNNVIKMNNTTINHLNNTTINNTVNNNESMTMDMSSLNATMTNTISGKTKRRKRQKYKRKQIKKLERQGLSQAEIDIKIQEIMEKKNQEMGMEIIEKKIEKKENKNKEIPYNINELVDRPKIASMPKFNLSLDKSENDSSEDELEAFDIDEYSQILDYYYKEKKRIKHDLNYRNNIISRNKELQNAKTEKEKESITQKYSQLLEMKGPPLDNSIEVKICDMGNACWFTYHFSTAIQTRQYRSPEVLLGINYNETADIWSLACIVFELATGDYLFSPRKGESYSKNDDHIAKFIRMLGKMPKNFALSGENSYKYFNRKGEMRRVHNIPKIPLKYVLMMKYHFKEKEAQALSDFIMPMLEYLPEKRASARELLNHPWLKMEPNFDVKMNDVEITKMNFFENIKNEEMENEKNNNFLYDDDSDNDRQVYTSESEVNEGDDEDNSEYDVEFSEDDKESEESGDENPDKVNIMNFNNSYAQYGQFVDLTSLDRANPQFDNIINGNDENKD